MTVKITSFQVENTKRVRAVKLEPTANGLTIIGGNNEQGKTSVLDAICWALGGNKYKPSNAQRDGSLAPPAIKIKLSNGLVVERKGKNSDLKITDPTGQKQGQKLLDSFVSQFALNLPKFLQYSNKEKALELLKILGLEQELKQLDQKEKQLYENRRIVGQDRDRKKKYIEELPYYSDAPAEFISASELIKQQQDILAINGENQRKRNNLSKLKNDVGYLNEQIDSIDERIRLLQIRKDNFVKDLEKTNNDIKIAEMSAKDLHDLSTKELEQQIQNIETINMQVQTNKEYDRAKDEFEQFDTQYVDLTDKIENVRKNKLDLLKNANLPLAELSIEDSELIYKGKKWDCMSGSDQLKVTVAIVKQLNTDCKFVLMDKLEQFDLTQLNNFNEYLIKEGLQVIATRVSTGNECSIIIEDGIGGSVEDLGVYKLEPEVKKERPWF